jgi:hypothetical protein
VKETHPSKNPKIEISYPPRIPQSIAIHGGKNETKGIGEHSIVLFLEHYNGIFLDVAHINLLGGISQSLVFLKE